MIPLENIFDIARDELKNNADEYVLDTNVKYYTLKLAYIRVNNRTDMQKYSYYSGMESGIAAERHYKCMPCIYQRD